MVKEVLEGIKRTEAEATGIVDEARKKKAEIIAKAREDSRAMIDAAKKQGAETVKQALAKAEGDAKQKTEEIGTEEAKAREALKQASSQNVSKAVDLVIGRIVG